MVGQVLEAQSRPAQVVQAAVDCFGRSVAGARPVEVGPGRRWPAALTSGRAFELSTRAAVSGCAERINQFLHLGLAAGAVGVGVGADHRVVDAPRPKLTTTARGSSPSLRSSPSSASRDPPSTRYLDQEAAVTPTLSE